MIEQSQFRGARDARTGTPDAASGPDHLLPANAERKEEILRLQIGVFGIAAMMLLVGLASIIGNQAERAESTAVPEAAPTTEPVTAPTQANPLADAGVVPDIVADPSPSPAVPLDVPPPAPAVAGDDAADQ
jgi:hypothetical protein